MTAPLSAPAAGRSRVRLWGGRRSLIVLVVLLGLCLRAIPILWGTVFLDSALFGFHPDEPKIVRVVDRFPESISHNHDYRYPLLVHDVLGVLWRGALEVVPIVEDDVPIAGEPRFERATVFGRGMLVLLVGLGGMALLAAFLRRLRVPEAIPWVLAAYSMQSFTVANTALVQTDLPLAIVLFGLLCAALAIERRGAWRPVRDPIVLGALLGAAVATKYTGLIGLLPIAVVVAMAFARGWARARAVVWGSGLVLLAAGAVFTLFVPGALFDSAHFFESLVYEFESKTQVAEFDGSRFFSRLTLALPVWLGGLAALGLVLERRARTNPVVLASIVMFCAYLFLVRQAFSADWALPLMPLVAVLSGLGLYRIHRHGGRAGTAVAVAAVLFGWSHAALTVRARYVEDTRYRLDAWLEAEYPTPVPVGVAPTPTRPNWASPRVPVGFAAADVHDRPAVVVMGHRDFEPVVEVHRDPRAYERFGFVFDPDKKEIQKLGPRDIDFYRDVLRTTGEIDWTPPEGHVAAYEYELVAAFRPEGWPLDMAGRELRVYRLAR